MERRWVQEAHLQRGRAQRERLLQLPHRSEQRNPGRRRRRKRVSSLEALFVNSPLSLLPHPSRLPTSTSSP